MILGLIFALGSAFGTNLGFLLKHRGAVLAPPIRVRHPVRSAADLFRSRWFLVGWLVSLVAWGLARTGHWTELLKIAQRMLDASSHFGSQLPEVFAGLPRAETPFPIAYPTAARPQAWAAGTPVLLLQLLLGLRPDHHRHVLETTVPRELPSWVGDLRLSGIRAFGRLWDARIDKGVVSVLAA